MKNNNSGTLMPRFNSLIRAFSFYLGSFGLF